MYTCPPNLAIIAARPWHVLTQYAVGLDCTRSLLNDFQTSVVEIEYLTFAAIGFDGRF